MNACDQPRVLDRRNDDRPFDRLGVGPQAILVAGCSVIGRRPPAGRAVALRFCVITATAGSVPTTGAAQAEAEAAARCSLGLMPRTRENAALRAKPEP